MKDIIEKSEKIVLRRIGESDSDSVMDAEQEPCNKQYVGQWMKEQHLSPLDKKYKENAIESERILLIPLTSSELTNINNDCNEICDGKIQIDLEAVSESIKSAITKKLVKMRMAPEEAYEWYTYWMIIDKNTQRGIGFIGFKGVPDENGYSEVGYGISPNYRRKGLMTETLLSIVKWAAGNPGCKGITAQKVLKNNIGSNNVLKNCGFKLIGSGEDTNEYIFMINKL